MNAFDLAFKDLPDVQLSPTVQELHLRYLLSLPEIDIADEWPDDADVTALTGAELPTDSDASSLLDAPTSPETPADIPASTEVVDLDTRRRRRRRRYLAGGITAAVLIAGTGTAAAFGVFRTVTNTETAYCFATTSLDDGLDNRIEFATQGSKEHPRDAAAAGLDICAAYWRAGIFQLGKPSDIDRVPTGGSYPIPPLVACVLPTEQAGIFPGDAATCTSLGLAPYDPVLIQKPTSQ